LEGKNGWRRKEGKYTAHEKRGTGNNCWNGKKKGNKPNVISKPLKWDIQEVVRRSEGAENVVARQQVVGDNGGEQKGKKCDVR